MLSQLQIILVLSSFCILGLVLYRYMRALKDLRGDVNKAFEAKIESYADKLWTEVLKKLEDLDQFRHDLTRLSSKQNAEIQRKIGALDQKVRNANDCSSKMSEIINSLDDVKFLVTDCYMTGEEFAGKVAGLVACVTELLREYRMIEEISRSKLSCISEENSTFVDICDEGLDTIKSM